MTNAETYLKPRQISKIELLASPFLPKSSIIDFQLGSKYASEMEEDI